MRRYHHIGIPTTEKKENEVYLADYKCYYVPFDTNPYGIEWMRYEPGCHLPYLVKNVAHIAFEVDDLEAEIRGRKILIQPNSPSPGVRVAFIVEKGAPVEFLEFSK
ncbi:MAG: hypothetical protein JXB26_06655 [Candidatus Aminicenantes bacterium]|nr:hypothetical protein [Candidatus Aminicenantes bacterium]